MTDVPPSRPIVLSDVKPSSIAPDPSENKGTPTSLGGTTSLDGARQVIAYILLAALIAVIAFSAVASAIYASPCLRSGPGMAEVCKQAQSGGENVGKTMGVILTAIIGLVGSVVGFYFGSSQKAGG